MSVNKLKPPLLLQLLDDLGAGVRHLLPAHHGGVAGGAAQEGHHAADQDEAGRRPQAVADRGGTEQQGGGDGAGQRQGRHQPRLRKKLQIETVEEQL